MEKNCHHNRLIRNINPLPSIIPASQSTANVSVAERERLNTKTARKQPTARVLQPDDFQRIKQINTIQNPEDMLLHIQYN